MRLKKLRAIIALGAVVMATTASAAEPPARPRIAVVIDDLGLTYKTNVPDEDWYALKVPMTFAVMPESPRTKEAARRAKESGHELIIHFPFDPFLSLELPKDSPSSGDLDKVTELLEKAFRDIPGAVGLNNHRSYRATQNRPLMRAFMPLLKQRGGYFLDSGVSPKTVAYDEARSAGIPALKNAVFLDEAKRHDKDFCVRMLRRGAAHARKHGSAVVIGHHYFHGTYEGLLEEVPKLQAEGFEFVFASTLLP
jgi:polysaccharide deacetylase 2 family uncharacterized protein YibQ